MHSTAGLDPTHPLRKRTAEISSKRGAKKTDADIEERDWIDYQLAIYHDGNRPFLPDTMLHGVIRDGAKNARKGREILSSVEIGETDIPLIYSGPTGVRELYDAKFVDRRRVVVQRAGVLRVRPRFNQWSAEFSVYVDESVINPDAVKTALEYGGSRVGIGDFRPRFGRFIVTKWSEVK